MKYYWDDKTKVDEMDTAFSIHWEDETSKQNFRQTTQREETTWET
jgi:hypothetical protein